MKRALLILLVLAGIFAAAAVLTRLGRRAPPVIAPTRANVLLITIDTFRADRVRRGLTPVIDGLADRGTRYDYARSVVPLTLPSHVTIMTGQLPAVHRVRENGNIFTPGSSTIPLARRFRDASYHTAGFIGAYVLDRRFGLADGFETYDDRIPFDANEGARLEAERSGGEVVGAALNWLAKTHAPFFLWVHLYDPHAPYEPPAEYRKKGGANPYDGEIAYVDAQVGRLLEALASRGLTSETVVVVVGDHGEGLGDHGEVTHGMLAYDSTLRVPLILAGPGAKPEVVTKPFSLVNLAPLLLSRAGVPDPSRPSSSDRMEIYAETRYPREAGWHPLTVLADDRWKLIRSSESELYDLSVDPAETQNVASDHTGTVQAMTTRLQQFEKAGSGTDAPVSAEAAERLRALGYVSASPSPGKGDSGANPATAIDAWNRFEAVLSLVNAGRAQEALGELQALSEKFPDATVFQTTYGRALKDAGRATDAVAVYRRAVERTQDAGLFHDLAVAARAAGNAEEALKAEEAALALEAKNPLALNGLGLLHAEAGRAQEAAAAFEQATALDASNPSYWTNLGNARRELSDVAGAEAAYRRALDVDSNYPDAANGFGVLLVQGGKPGDAIPWLERAVAQSPDFYEAKLNLGIALQESGERDRAASVYREIVERAPERFAREKKAAGDLLKQIAR
jgi:arylsulfatase A-like enzyme/Flp pilus assembly protein TadD